MYQCMRNAYLKRPPAHGVGNDAPATQNPPAVHGSHAVAPSCALKVPSAQLAHSPVPEAVEYIVPPPHSAGAAAPSVHM
jgi:hypothetical protein